MLAASQSVAKPLARSATRVAAQAPQAKAKARLRQGSGATRSSQQNAAIRSGTGKTARPRPTRKPSVPVSWRTMPTMITPDSANIEISARARSVLLCQGAVRRRCAPVCSCAWGVYGGGVGADGGCGGGWDGYTHRP